MKYPKGLETLEKAKQWIAGTSPGQIRRSEFYSDGAWPSFFKKAKGVEVWDIDDNHFIDMAFAGDGSTLLGYADPEVDQAVMEVLQSGAVCTLDAPEMVELAEYFNRIHPWAKQTKFAKTKTEALGIAVRIARAYTKKDKIIQCGEHGWQDWYLGANLKNPQALDNYGIKGLPTGGVPGCYGDLAYNFDYGRIEQLREIMEKNPGQIAAVVFEPDPGRKVRPDFLLELEKAIREMEAVFIVNESRTAYRMSTGGAHLSMGITPDMAVFSNSIANGYPISAVIGSQEVMDAHKTTFIDDAGWQERIGAKAALVCMKKCAIHDVAFHLLKIGKRFQDGITQLAEQFDIKLRVKGYPALPRIDFRDENAPEVKAFFVQKMLDFGFLASDRFYPTFAHETDHVTSYLLAVKSTFGMIQEAQKESRLKELLKGKPSAMNYNGLD
ncbi:MAG: aminotransferase class III-fold pyridoxal phosphate-dependent enzyme [Deltaproteobacteria bacterium]|nr:aminotransferase class III-fold pyridoxal phosphate-dependent enzyme [Deltaproteobacteria bacterium]